MIDNLDTLPYEAGIDGVPLEASNEECGGDRMGIVFPKLGITKNPDHFGDDY